MKKRASKKGRKRKPVSPRECMYTHRHHCHTGCWGRQPAKGVEA